MTSPSQLAGLTVTIPLPVPQLFVWGDVIIKDNKEMLWRKCQIYDGSEGSETVKPYITVLPIDMKGNLDTPDEPRKLVNLDSELGSSGKNPDTGMGWIVTMYLTGPRVSDQVYEEEICIDFRGS